MTSSRRFADLVDGRDIPVQSVQRVSLYTLDWRLLTSVSQRVLPNLDHWALLWCTRIAGAFAVCSLGSFGRSL